VAKRPFLIHRVITRLNVGGPAMHVANLAGALSDDAWRTRLIAGSIEDDEGDMAYYAEERGVEVTYVPAMARSISPLADLKTLWRLYRLFRRERPDVVHTHTAKAGTLGRIAAVLARVPVVVHTYHGHALSGGYFAPWKTRFFLEVERLLARVTNRLVVLTNRQAEQMSHDLRVAARQRFSVVPLGLELDRFLAIDRLAERRSIRSELDIRLNELVVGIVGRMVPIKNHELFLDLLPDLFSKVPGPARALVIGAGERETMLRARAEALGIQDRVTWLGWRRDLP
jgi:glycosyltransferase involved in cell wall biosynthesis